LKDHQAFTKKGDPDICENRSTKMSPRKGEHCFQDKKSLRQIGGTEKHPGNNNL
jgi:hypothetical protein